MLGAGFCDGWELVCDGRGLFDVIVLFRENVLYSTKCPALMVLFRRNVLTGQKALFQEIEEMSLELHSNIKHQPGPSGARLIIYNMLIINTKQTFSTTIRN